MSVLTPNACHFDEDLLCVRCGGEYANREHNLCINSTSQCARNGCFQPRTIGWFSSMRCVELAITEARTLLLGTAECAADDCTERFALTLSGRFLKRYHSQACRKRHGSQLLRAREVA